MFQRWSNRPGGMVSNCHGEGDEAGPLFLEGYDGGQKRLLQVDVRKDDVFGVSMSENQPVPGWNS